MYYSLFVAPFISSRLNMVRLPLSIHSRAPLQTNSLLIWTNWKRKTMSSRKRKRWRRRERPPFLRKMKWKKTKVKTRTVIIRRM